MSFSEVLSVFQLTFCFQSVAELPQPQRLDALRCLVWLLPMPNRDTLQQLLSFLAAVAEYSEDRIDANGKTVNLKFILFFSVLLTIKVREGIA